MMGVINFLEWKTYAVILPNFRAIDANMSISTVWKHMVCGFRILTSAYTNKSRLSYCNSILQCLYYSVPFREQVINYPKRSPLESVNTTSIGLPKLNTNTSSLPNGHIPLSPTKAKAVAGPNSARNPGGPVPPQKPEDKESPEYKKKQAMAKGPVLSMNHDNTDSYGMPESLFTSLKDIFEAVIANQSRTGVVSPTKFLEILRKENEMFRTSMHQDAHEFLNLLLNEVVANVETNSRKLEAQKGLNGSANMDGFEKALTTAMPNTTGSRSPSNTGWVHELFEGTLTSETKCLTCENVSQRDEAFLDLSVDLDQHSSVTSCLRKFSEEEMLCERNKFHCDMCGGLQEAEKRMKIKRLPKILALHLKRFKYTEDLQRLQKLFHRVVYPYHLRLFNTTDDAEDPDRLYELYAVVVHIGGGPYHGHYVAIIKTQDRGWLLFDDELVEPVDKNYVRNFFGERPGLACAYVLFYQETTLEAVKREEEAEGLAAAAQAPIPHKEAVGLGLRSQLLTNGIHTVQSAISPPASPNEDQDHWAALDKSATTPPTALFHPPPPTPAATPKVSSSAPTSQIQALDPITAEHLSPSQPPPHPPPSQQHPTSQIEALDPLKVPMSKKERKIQEKELEKQDRIRRRNTEKEKREEARKQAADMKAAMEASRLSKVEDKRIKNEESAVKFAGTENGESGHRISKAGSSGSSGGTLSRWRAGSKSMSRKSKLWGSKDLDSPGASVPLPSQMGNHTQITAQPQTSSPKNSMHMPSQTQVQPQTPIQPLTSTPAQTPAQQQSQPETPARTQPRSHAQTPSLGETPPPNTTPSKPEKEKKHRFSSLRKKTSAMLL